MARTRNPSGSSPLAPPAKRRRVGASKSMSSDKNITDPTCDGNDQVPEPLLKKTATAHATEENEKRLRRFRSHPPGSFQQRLERALSQRMFVIDRVRHDTNGVPEEVIELAGSTGNIYTIKINQVPSCTCQDHIKGNQCKHIVYVMHLVLKAPSHLEYQLALLRTELNEIFAQSPPLPSSGSSEDAYSDKPSNQKPVEGDCPICFMAFESDSEEIVWCKAACGNNIHRECFERWAQSQHGKEVRCVYCRTRWEGDDDSLGRIKDIKSKGEMNDEGYRNVGLELGMSSERDTSSYHQVWVRAQRRSGALP